MDTHDTQEISIRIVDDDEGFRTGIQRILDTVGLESVCYESVSDYLDAETYDLPGCMLLDLYMPGATGIDLWNVLADNELRLPTIFISARGDVPISVRTLKEGAIDFLTKPVEAKRLLESVRRALRVDTHQRVEYKRVKALISKYETLAKLERAVFRGVVSGKLNKQLAGELDKCERTIKTYRAQVMSKFDVNNLPDLVRIGELLERIYSDIE